MYERVLEVDALLDVLPRMDKGLLSVTTCLRQGGMIANELDELEKRQNDLENLVKENKASVDRVGKITICFTN